MAARAAPARPGMRGAEDVVRGVHGEPEPLVDPDPDRRVGLVLLGPRLTDREVRDLGVELETRGDVRPGRGPVANAQHAGRGEVEGEAAVRPRAGMDPGHVDPAVQAHVELQPDPPMAAVPDVPAPGDELAADVLPRRDRQARRTGGPRGSRRGCGPGGPDQLGRRRLQGGGGDPREGAATEHQREGERRQRPRRAQAGRHAHHGPRPRGIRQQIVKIVIVTAAGGPGGDPLVRVAEGLSGRGTRVQAARTRAPGDAGPDLPGHRS